MEDYCCIIVGNKTDLISSDTMEPSFVVSEAEALRFLDELVPLSSRPASPIGTGDALTAPQLDIQAESIRTPSIDINPSSRRWRSSSTSRSRSSTRPLNGTLTSTISGMTPFHTPSSSLFDTYTYARPSPFPTLCLFISIFRVSISDSRSAAHDIIAR
ncbi:hypothetical protein F5I97DRAFT_2051481 [Phlebopus sp. FC_14]|nr:hypothetical protein F5I97DRAFT_2051481 [Phlebopus sp. FC_14]